MTFHFLIVPKGFPTLDLFREGKFYPFWGLHKWGGGGSYNCLHCGERLSWIFLNILENPGRSRKEGHDKLKLSSNWSIFACLWSTLDKVKQSQLRKKSPHCQSIGRTIWFIISRLDNQVFGEELGLISGTCSSRVSKEQLYGKRISHFKICWPPFLRILWANSGQMYKYKSILCLRGEIVFYKYANPTDLHVHMYAIDQDVFSKKI